MRNIFIFIGMAGVGKTTICKKVARYFNSSFIDIDHAFIDHYQISIVDFIKINGSKKFNDIESKMVENSLQNYSFISPGGSFIYSSDIIENISKDVVFIYLKALFAEVSLPSVNRCNESFSSPFLAAHSIKPHK